MKMALVKTLLDAAAGHIKHKLGGWKYADGTGGAADVVHMQTRDRYGELWSWAVSPNDRHGHTRWAVVRCSVGQEIPTRLDVDLPDWSDLGELLKECVMIMAKVRKGDPRWLEAQARYRERRRAAHESAPAQEDAPPEQMGLFG